MEKNLFKIMLFSIITTSLFAESTEFTGCNDLNHNINSENAEYVKSMISNNIQVKNDFLQNIGFTIEHKISYENICKRIILITNSNSDNIFSIINSTIEESILNENNISLNDYNSRLNKKLSVKED